MNFPNHIVKYNIYDIFYNDTKLIIIRPMELLLDIYVGDKKMNMYTCPHSHTYVYTLKIPYTKTIVLRINSEVIHTYVNTYPICKNEIIMTTLVKNEDNYIKQWIDFHLHIGITRFIIYDNSNSTTLTTLLRTYIDSKQVILIRWNVPYRLPKSGISGQTTQQNHCIYAFSESQYIGLMDIDEYINMQKHTNIHDFFEDTIKKYQLNTAAIGSFVLSNKFFYNPRNLPTDGNKFLHIFNCDITTKHTNQKNFVIPKNVKTFSVHTITDGKPSIVLDDHDIFFNHYVYLNKSDRGRNKTTHIDSSILNHLKY